MPAPRLLYYSPAMGEELVLDGVVELTFDQAMDQPTVEEAITISPKVMGDVVWDGDYNVKFVPEEAWDRGTHYQVTVGESAKNREGTSLEEPITFAFDTVGFLQVSEIQPANDSVELDPDTAVTVVFNRPVVPLTSIDQQVSLPDPLVFSPTVSGQGEWLNTSIYIFRPDEGFRPATRYEARVTAGLEDTIGGILAEDYTWNFTTIRPAVLNRQPGDDYWYAAPTDTVRLTFNQPMDHTSAEQSFSLTYGTDFVTGTISWSGGETFLSPETMTFTPDEPLPRDTTFTAELAKGVLARSGTMATARATSWQFSTVKEPGIVSITPRDGATDVELYDYVEIVFRSPMRRDGSLDYITFSPPITNVYSYWRDHDTKVRISFDKDPRTSYGVSVSADMPEKYGLTVGEERSTTFTTGDLSDYAVLNTSGRLGMFNGYEPDSYVFASYRNVSSLQLGLYYLSLSNFMKINGFADWSYWRDYNPGADELIRRWTMEVEAPPNETRLVRVDLADDEGAPLPPGLYYLQLTAPGVTSRSRFVFVKTRTSLTLKQGLRETLVWATDLATGRPLPDLEVHYYNNLASTYTGTTDEQGIARREDLGTANVTRSFFVVVGEPGNEDFAIAYDGWTSGIDTYDFNLPRAYSIEGRVGHIYTERPIYRPGQPVYFKGILRQDDDAHYSLPTELNSIQVRINDAYGKEVYKESLPLSDMGSVFDEFMLDEEAPLGTYYVYLGTNKNTYARTSFQVAEYRKPEYQVAVEADQDNYAAGDTINVTVEATYFFGGPVADAKVHWSVLSDGFTFSYDCPGGQRCPRYRWTDEEWRYYWYYYEEDYGYDFGELIAEGDTQTDSQGRVTFQVPADILQETQSQIFTIEASVTDINNQMVSNRTAAIVHKGEFYVGIAPQGYLVEAGNEKTVDLIAADWFSDPVADVPLTVVFMKRRWYSVKRQDEGGYYYWTWTVEDTPVYTTTATTGEEGRATAAFTPETGGSYRVRVIGSDDRGAEMRSSAFFWVWGGGPVRWRRESNNRIDLIADQDEYQVGDVAEILVPSPFTGTVHALVTIERGHLMEHQVHQFSSSSEVLRLQIKEEYVPNVFVSVIIVQGTADAPDGMATFKMGLVNLPVSAEVKELNISMTPDRSMEQNEHYGPRQTASYDILVTDHAGNPVEAELSLRLADLAVLILADEVGPTLLERFWSGRGLGVQTSLALTVAMEPFNRELAPGAKGGGGGGEEEMAGFVRTRFADTAFWEPDVRTGPDGRAQVSVELPDNLTTWRMQARGITADTLVGRAEVDVLSTLDLLVRPVLPRFFVVGDRADIGTIVHNNSAEDLEVRVSLTVAGLDLEGPASVTVTVAPGDNAKVNWPVSVPPGREVMVRMEAQSGTFYDGREDILPVYRYSTPEVVGTAGRISEPGVRQELIQLPLVFDPTQGELTVKIDGSLTGATKDALDYLKHYPYECVEQTVSRFLPNVLTYQILEEMGLDQPELRENLELQVSVALQRLYARQCSSGGWGWWRCQYTNSYLTAYALHGMLEAHRAGFTVDRQSMGNAARYLRGNLYPERELTSYWRVNRQAYVIYVLAEYGLAMGTEPSSSELSRAVNLFEKRHLLSRYGQATLAMALGLMEGADSSRVETLLSDLHGDAIYSATGTHWEEEEPDYWNMNTDIRSTAIVIWATSRLRPESELLPNAVRWLMTIRKEGYWRTTQATAWSLMGLVAYMRASGELHGDFSYSVYLNGETWDSGDVTKENIDETRVLEIEIANLLVEESNRLIIQRHPPQAGQTGEGQLYYTAHLRYFLPADQVEALDRGIIVSRQYTLVDDPDTPVESAQVGDVIRVQLTMIAPTDLYYVVVEDPLPAGCEGVDTSLNTTSVVGERPNLRNLTAEEESRWYRWYGWGWWWFSHTEMRDEKVVLFASYLPRGTYQYTYTMRASVPGEFLVMPTFAYEMYFPEVFGRSDGGKFFVVE
jgi:uncharacterized protein YfaS (alpha-2-macroglobulin family)